MKRWGWPLAITWVLCVGYAAQGLDRGWIPHDEGTIGQSADRVLAGQLPHRDYDEIYTGGLALVDAAAFRVFGADLLSPRLMLLLVFALWVPAMFYVASRFLGPVAAAGATIAAAVWSIPNYSAAMPSWFNLFFAGFGIACLIRHAETGAGRGRGRWIFWAGVCGGLSCLFKIVGLYYIAGALLFLVYREQVTAGESSERSATWYRVLVGGALLLFVAAIFDLLRGRWTGGDIGLFAFPSAALAALLMIGEPGRGASGSRLAALTRSAGLLAAGVALPVLLFLLPYLFTHGLSAVAYDVFVAPARRLSFASMRAPGLNTFPYALLFIVPVGLFWWRRSWGRGVGIGMAILLTAVWVLSFKGNYYRIAWCAFQWAVPLCVVGGAFVLRPWVSRDTPSVRSQQLFALLAVTAVAALIQFPFSSPVYFLYVAPLAMVSAAAVLKIRFDGVPSGDTFVGVLLLFAVLFPLRWVRPGFTWDYGFHYKRYPMPAWLPGRAGLWVTTADSVEYTGMTALVTAHARGGYVYATPDCPEVNFLTGTKNPTRTLFDFFDDPVNRTSRILARLDTTGVTTVVLNHKPGFSGPVPNDLAAALALRYPHVESIGRFEVRWRE